MKSRSYIICEQVLDFSFRMNKWLDICVCAARIYRHNEKKRPQIVFLGHVIFHIIFIVDTLNWYMSN